MPENRIVLLNEGMYDYPLPPLPKEEDIWYYGLPVKDQYWKTPHNTNFKWLNQDGTIKSVKRMSEKERVEYIEYWRDKWENGLWFMNEGEPTYINGIHVDHLIFNLFKSKHFIYLDAQRERFYFRELTDNDRKCSGRIWIKGRRAGITSEQITHSIRTLISDYGNGIGLQSDIRDKAKSTLLSPLIDAYIKRPVWMREHYYNSNGKTPRQLLELTAAVLSEDDNYPLGGKARAFPTTVKALDGEEFMQVTMDEISKWEDVSPYETFEVNKKTIVNPGKFGKMDLLSTTGDSKEVVKSVQDWHKLIAGSNPKVRNKNGQTNTGLYEYFVSGIHSMELVELLPEVLSKYGKVNREMAEEYIWNDVNKYEKNSKDYVYALYKMPLHKNHALLTVSSNSYFPKIKITARLDELRQLPVDEKPYVRGRLKEGQNGKVYFEADEYGHWLIAVHPYFSTEHNIDTRNRFTKTPEGVYHPPINPEFGVGYDPTRYRKEDTTSASLSRAAIVAYKKFDYFNSGIHNRYAALYLHRSDDPKDDHREALKLCRYLGAPMMFERVIESVKEVAEDMNMIPFLQRSEKDNLHGMVIDSMGKTVKNAVSMMQTKFAPPKEDGDVDQFTVMPFEECLMDMDMVDLGDTQKFDTFMAMVELEYSLKQITYTNLTDKSTSSMIQTMQELMAPRRR